MILDHPFAPHKAIARAKEVYHKSVKGASDAAVTFFLIAKKSTVSKRHDKKNCRLDLAVEDVLA